MNLVLYAPVLDNGFSLDDFNWLARAEFASSWWRFVFDVEPGQILNPVPRALFLLVVQASGSGPFPVHLTVLVLHIVTVGLFLHLVDKVVKDRTIALLAAVSAPTALGVQVARECGQTLIGFARGAEFSVYSHPRRVVA